MVRLVTIGDATPWLCLPPFDPALPAFCRLKRVPQHLAPFPPPLVSNILCQTSFELYVCQTLTALILLLVAGVVPLPDCRLLWGRLTFVCGPEGIPLRLCREATSYSIVNFLSVYSRTSLCDMNISE